MKPTWIERNSLLRPYGLNNSSIVDFGCGDKSILSYYSPTEYIGLDKDIKADIVVDFDTQTVTLDKVYDVGLILGVLEYLNDPDLLIENYKASVKRFIIMVLTRDNPKVAHGWKRAFNDKSFKLFIEHHFKKFTITKHNRYLIAECIS
jgi:hypothetical protein